MLNISIESMLQLNLTPAWMRTSAAGDIRQTHFDGSSNCSTTLWSSICCKNVLLLHVQRSSTCTKEPGLFSRERTTSLLNSYSIPMMNSRLWWKILKENDICLRKLIPPTKWPSIASFIKPTEMFLGIRGDTARNQGKLTQVLTQADTGQIYYW